MSERKRSTGSHPTAEDSSGPGAQGQASGPGGQGQPCPRCGSLVEDGDLRCPTCLLPVPGEHASTERTVASVLRCEGCGAAVVYDAAAQVLACAFCGGAVHVERPEDPLEEAEAFLPFEVDHRAAHAALSRWLRGLGWFRPSDLADRAAIDSLRPLWWCAWLVDAEARVSRAADSDAGARRADWAPHAGQGEILRRGLVLSASRGLSAPECAALAERYELDTARPAGELREPHLAVAGGAADSDSGGGGGGGGGGGSGSVGGGGEESTGPRITVEGFELQRSAARRRIRDALAALAQEVAKTSWIPGKRIRNLHLEVMLERLRARRYLLPAHVVAWRYRGRSFRAVVHGQDAELVIGTAPISPWRVAAAILAGLALLAGIVAVLVAAS